MRNITRHIIHCSATPNERDIGVIEIDKYHRERGWDCIGYHFVIRRNGVLEYGRPVEKIGAHCKGYNSDSIGTCLIGDDMFTTKQLKTLVELDELIKHMYNKDITTHGHREFNSGKTCPNFEVANLKELFDKFNK